MYDILEPPAFLKYGTCWIFLAPCMYWCICCRSLKVKIIPNCFISLSSKLAKQGCIKFSVSFKLESFAFSLSTEKAVPRTKKRSPSYLRQEQRRKTDLLQRRCELYPDEETDHPNDWSDCRFSDQEDVLSNGKMIITIVHSLNPASDLSRNAKLNGIRSKLLWNRGR